jgi:hypothetical protein
LKIEYLVKRTGNPSEAEILQSGQLVAHLENASQNGRILSRLKTEDGTGRVYELDPRVDGVISPFSSEIYDKGKPVLKIKSGVFSHDSKVYMFKSLPEGVSMKGHLNGIKSVTRLDNFPYKSVGEIDRDTRERLLRYRGVEVGKISGLGTRGHKVVLDEELSDIGLPLSAASYLLYSTG